jgi:hypothetical protein
MENIDLGLFFSLKLVPPFSNFVSSAQSFANSAGASPPTADF